ncbi:aldo/keto reductase [candidate division KSB1 bacterium]
MNRRDFLKAAVASGLASYVPLSRDEFTISDNITKKGPLPRRPLGKTGESLSIIGLGGVIFRKMEDTKRAKKIVTDAVEAGVNFVDVAPAYGNAQKILGPILKPHRKDLFLACKSQQRTKEGMLGEMRESFSTLKTDYFDLYQMHYLNTSKDIRTAFGKDGAVEAIEQAKKEGLIRYAGFSAHTVEAAMEAMELYDFDTILFPVNFPSWYKENFGPQVIEYAIRKGIAVLGMKTQVLRQKQRGETSDCPNCWYKPILDPLEASTALNFALSKPVTTVMPPGDEGLFRMTLKLAHSFIPVTENEKDTLKMQAKEINRTLFEYPAKNFKIVQD